MTSHVRPHCSGDDFVNILILDAVTPRQRWTCFSGRKSLPNIPHIRGPQTYWASVMALLKACGPTDVSWFVMAVVVDPLQRQLRTWAGSNVTQESREIIHPLGAHPNATPAVPMVVLSRRIRASSSGVQPRAVLRTESLLPTREAVFSTVTSTATTTRLLDSRHQMSSQYAFFYPAVASTHPSHRPATVDSMQDDQLTESLTGQIFKIVRWHIGSILPPLTLVNVRGCQ